MSTIYTWERITCDDVKVGDKIARVRTHDPMEVAEIREGDAARRLIAPGGYAIRPRRTAQLWRVEAEEPGLIAEAVPAVEPVTEEPISAPVIAALETAWAGIRRRNPEVPAAVLITGSGAGRLRNALVRGHYAVDAWQRGDGKLPEVFISGERMQDGAEGVLSTLLHEAAHGLATARGIQDTSRQNRYHNGRFKALAEELGLSCTKDPRIGWSPTELADETAVDYAVELGELERALTLHRPLRLVKQDENTRKSPPPAECGCGRKIRVAPSVLELAPITCGACGEDFTVEEEN